MHYPDNLDELARDIILEDNHLLAVNKHPGDIVQGDKTGDIPLSELVKSYIKQKHHKPGEVFLGVVHRLDRPVSGVVLFARTSKALARMNELMRNRLITKIYWAIVANPLPEQEGRMIHWLVKNEEKNKSVVMSPTLPQGREAELHYKVLGFTRRYYFVEIKLITGRHHQIRAQLAASGSPIRGDLKYGAPRSNPDGSIHLHARSMEFIHPVKQDNVILLADPPKDALWDAFLLATQSGFPSGHLEH